MLKRVQRSRLHTARQRRHHRPKHSRFQPPGSEVELTNDTALRDVADDRFIFACAMALSGQPLSSSLVTITRAAEGSTAR